MYFALLFTGLFLVLLNQEVIMKKRTKKQNMTKDDKQKVYMALVYFLLFLSVLWTVYPIFSTTWR